VNYCVTLTMHLLYVPRNMSTWQYSSPVCVS